MASISDSIGCLISPILCAAPENYDGTKIIREVVNNIGNIARTVAGVSAAHVRETMKYPRLKILPSYMDSIEKLLESMSGIVFSVLTMNPKYMKNNLFHDISKSTIAPFPMAGFVTGMLMTIDGFQKQWSMDKGVINVIFGPTASGYINFF